MTTTRYFPFLSRDFSRLLETGQNPDISIKVGNGAMTRNFRAHSLILHARSRFFAKLLVDKCTYSAGDDAENSLPVLNSQVLDRITPAVFEILLRYMYGGNLPLENRGGRHVLDLLIGADLLDLTDILDEIQDHLVKNNSDWLVENFGIISRTVLDHPNFKILHDCYIDVIRTRPEGIFDAKDFLSLPIASLIEILKNDDVAMEEVDIWKRVLDWGIAQTPNLLPNTAGWSLLEFVRLQKTLQDCLPYIRFFQLSSAEFQDHVMPYLSILGNQLRTDILSYHLKPGYKPTTPIAPPRYGSKSLIISKMVPHHYLDSTIVNKRHAALLSLWIDRRENETPTTFRSSDENQTNDSFVFSFGTDFPRSAILSRVCEPSQAVYCHRVWGPSFGVFDLALHGNFAEDGMCRSQRGQYECEIRSPDSEDFSVEEYEVFQVIDHMPQKDINNRALSSSLSRKLYIYSLVVLGLAGVISALSFWFVLSEYCPCGLFDTIEQLKRTIISIT
ncbi:5365_t:CDS:2 [Ambispora leptoticha]|uniref:5365_t:CDS:1 n=1 Tax=Ambispora leptoticha TaxID=144679 RepID=A0A9N9BCB9_9GLOM|nr:5365_t:CDS:2 [Ambispora leptoticha]